MVPTNSYGLLIAELYNIRTEFELYNTRTEFELYNTRTEFNLWDR